MSNFQSLTVRAPFGIIILGCPGSGKGTQGTEVAKQIGGTHLSSGDTIGGIQQWPEEWGLTSLCQLAKQFRLEGKLAPDDVINKIFDAYWTGLLQHPKPFIIEGVPRTVGQASHMLRTIHRTVGPDFPIWLPELVLPTVQNVEGEEMVKPEAEAEMLRRVLARPDRLDSTEEVHRGRMDDFKNKALPGYKMLKLSGRFAQLKKPINALSPPEQVTKYIVQKIVGKRRDTVAA